MKKIMILSAVIGLALCSSRLMSNSEGAPKATGAAGEGTCTQCHGGSVNSDANGSVAITIDGNPVNFGPGLSYNINVTTTYTNRSRFGFAMSAKNTSNSDIGTFSSNGNANVWVPTNYATHSAAGTAGTSGTKTWKFKWTAPATGTSAVTFYVAGMASNNNNDDDPGDKVFTKTKVLPFSATAGVSETSSIASYSVFPNPASGTIHIEFCTRNAGIAEAALTDMQGRMVDVLMKEEVSAGNFAGTFRLGENVSPGLYLLSINQGGSTVVNKLFVE
jgi:hypothetical protein